MSGEGKQAPSVWEDSLDPHLLRGPFQVIHLSYVLLLDGCTGRYYFGFISIFASLPAFLSLVPIYHTKIHAIFWDLYVGCPDMYSQKCFCLTALNIHNSGALEQFMSFFQHVPSTPPWHSASGHGQVSPIGPSLQQLTKGK